MQKQSENEEKNHTNKDDKIININKASLLS